MTNVTEKLYRICFMRIRYLLFLIDNNNNHETVKGLNPGVISKG